MQATEQRTCEQPGCITRLSSYTTGTICRPCQRAQDDAELERDWAAAEPEPEPIVVVVLAAGGRWAKAWDRCRGCGLTDRPHWGRGLCGRCHSHERYVPKLPGDHWKHPNFAACRVCGGTQHAHRSGGVCTVCWRAQRASGPLVRRATCLKCGTSFIVATTFGPIPLYCLESCRKQMHVVRTARRRLAERAG